MDYIDRKRREIERMKELLLSLRDTYIHLELMQKELIDLRNNNFISESDKKILLESIHRHLLEANYYLSRFVAQERRKIKYLLEQEN